MLGQKLAMTSCPPKDQSNRSQRLPEYAVWEIHPVMASHVVQ
jgi:hypothetical protein